MAMAPPRKLLVEEGRSDKALDPGTVLLGQCFWEGRAAKLSSLACVTFTVALFTLMAHNPALGSFYCPLSQCAANKLQHQGHEHLNVQNEILAVVCFFLGGCRGAARAAPTRAACMQRQHG